MELVIGTKRWSSWSLRPWLALKRTGASFEEIEVQLRQGAATDAAIAQHSPSGQVPVLKVGDLTIWDSLAICEYLAETFPEAKLWPEDPILRALGRSAAAEMHGGFQALRGECPMALDIRTTLEISEATQKNVRTIVGRWNRLLTRSGGPFLLGDWSIADAFYAPVATRFRTYGIRLSEYGDAGAAQAYAERLLATPEFLEWERASLA
ncbi:glutathione S-transferase family protein [Caulobacter sp. 602-1]|uniref:glutathione S-transferase family protein n=1 Tax=Caulobacter sp. 602-1 TaxID=2492472 RepID=UPI000F642FDF|nr:glutathione S-transferase family protein [Caulobacter sp. 602-1]RRN65375.1 glutathione S-transferase family protein [Caulobacter sp. 602-1]